MPFNFAFGANMDTRCLTDRRGIRPKSSKPAVLHDYVLTFDYPGMPFVEPAFANVQPAPGKQVHGVLIDLSDDDWATLERLEGGVGTSRVDQTYALETVRVQTYDGLVVAESKDARAEEPSAYPSARYAFLLARGARNSGLSDEYCRFVRRRRPPLAPHSPRTHPARTPQLEEQPFFEPHGLGFLPYIVVKFIITRPFFFLLQLLSKNGLPSAWLWSLMHAFIKPSARAFDRLTGHALSKPRVPPPDLSLAFPNFARK